MYEKPQRHTQTLKEQILPKQQELGFGRTQKIQALPKKDAAQGNQGKTAHERRKYAERTHLNIELFTKQFQLSYPATHSHRSALQ